MQRALGFGEWNAHVAPFTAHNGVRGAAQDNPLIGLHIRHLAGSLNEVFPLVVVEKKLETPADKIGNLAVELNGNELAIDGQHR